MAPDDRCRECAPTTFNVHRITHGGNRAVEKVLISAEFAFGHDLPGLQQDPFDPVAHATSIADGLYPSSEMSGAVAALMVRVGTILIQARPNAAGVAPEWCPLATGRSL